MTLASDAKFEEKLTCGLENATSNLENFHQSSQKSPNLDFYWVLTAWKVSKGGFSSGPYFPVFGLNTGINPCVQSEYWKIQTRKIQKGIDLPVENWYKVFNRSWPEHLKISRISTLLGCFWPKYIMFELRNYRRVMFDGTQDWCDVWRKTDLYFQNWLEEFDKFSPKHLKVSKLGLWCHPLLQSWKYMSLKFTGKLCVMTMKNDAKIKKTLTCQFKIDIRNLKNKYLSTQNTPKVGF